MYTYLFELADFNGDGLVNVTDQGLQATVWQQDWRNLSLFGDLDGDWDLDADDHTLALSLGWTAEEIDILMDQIGTDLEIES